MAQNLASNEKKMKDPRRAELCPNCYLKQEAMRTAICGHCSRRWEVCQRCYTLFVDAEKRLAGEKKCGGTCALLRERHPENKIPS